MLLLSSARRRYPIIISFAVALFALSALLSACATQQASGKSATSPTALTYKMDGPSMLPTLHAGQTVTAQPYGSAQPQRGDIIAFHPPNNATVTLIKRIIALPGETIRVDANGAVYINGARLSEPYLNNATNPYQPNTWTLGQDQYFVMGDNRGSSSDSRDWGPVFRASIIGKMTSASGG